MRTTTPSISQHLMASFSSSRPTLTVATGGLKLPKQTLTRNRSPSSLHECAQRTFPLSWHILVCAGPSTQTQANPAAVTSMTTRPTLNLPGQKPPTTAQVQRDVRQQRRDNHKLVEDLLRCSDDIWFVFYSFSCSMNLQHACDIFAALALLL